MDRTKWKCPGCGAVGQVFQAYRVPQKKWQEMLGGWRCSRCACAMPSEYQELKDE